MKSNMFQNKLVIMFAVVALVATSSMSVGKCQPADFVGSCGVFDERDFNSYMDAFANKRPDRKIVTKKFDEIMNEDWHKRFKCYLLDTWGFWTPDQKQQVVDRMLGQGIISSEQAKNWQYSEYPPCAGK